MATPYFGRTGKLVLTPQTGGGAITLWDASWGTEALRCTFEIGQAANQSYWFADIALYNCTSAMYQTIQKGDVVQLTAGYENPGAGLIFHGRVYQPIWERADETSYRLTLHCLVGLFEDENALVSVTIPANTNAYDAINLVLGQTEPKIPIDYLDPILKQSPKLPRAEAFSGRAMRYFVNAAINQHLACYLSCKGLNIRSLITTKTTPDVVYAPPYSTRSDTAAADEAIVTKYILIGTPSQTEQGVNWRTLLDPSVQIGTLAKLDQATPNRVRLYPGQLAFLDPDGLYTVVGARHIGDSRGNEWYTEITAVTRIYGLLTGSANLSTNG